MMWSLSASGLRLRKKAASCGAVSCPCAKRLRDSSNFCGAGGTVLQENIRSVVTKKNAVKKCFFDKRFIFILIVSEK